VLDLPFRADPTHPDPVYRQLADHLAEWIRAGRLPAGERVPPTRELAAALGLSRNTVTRAYEWLAEAGFLGAHVGRGTFVESAARAKAPVLPTQDAGRPSFAWPALFATRMHALRAPRAFRAPDPDAVRWNFRPGQVDAAGLPISDLQGAWQRAVGRLRDHANDFDPLGEAKLRAAIARQLSGRGIARHADEVLVTSGAQQAFDLIARALVDPGDAVVVEDPGYFLAAMAFRAAGAQVIGVGVDAEGLRVDEVARTLRTRRVKLACVTPSVQLPTGVALSPERRAALLDLADRAQMPVIEDDYDCEMRLVPHSALALKTLDPGERVIYVGTFSKALFPGLRLGYVVGAPALLGALSRVRATASQQPSLVDQMAVAELLSSDALERHVRRVRKRNAERLRATMESLAAEMPAGTRFREPCGGTSVWVELPGGVDCEALAAAAAQRGIVYGRGEAFRVDGEGPPALLLSFAGIAPDAIRGAVAEIAGLVRRQGARPRRNASHRVARRNR
jgi:GntR family transcriptional regulator/MocR family aminotransferase